MISEKEILDIFQINPESGLYLLHKKYADICFSVAFRYLQNHEDAEEKVIDTFFSAFKNLSKFKYEREGLLKMWLKKICINHCLQLIRQKKNIVLSDINDVQIASKESHLDTLNYDDLMNILGQLPEIQKLVFQLYEIDGYTHPEISEQLNIGLGTSKSYLHRAKATLKLLISKENCYYE
jgi:RNA polymerase sigma factor (sigma-70 family)